MGVIVLSLEAAELWSRAKEFFSFDFFFGGKNILTTTVIALMGVLVSVLSSRRSRNFSTSKEYLEKVVSPIFEICEKFLMKKSKAIKSSEAEKIFKIIDENLLISGGKFREWRFKLESEFKKNGRLQAKTQEHFLNFVDSEYDKTCRQVGIALRPWRYRTDYSFPFSIKGYLHFFFWLVLLFIYVEYCFVILATTISLIHEKEYATAIVGTVVSALALPWLYRELERHH